MPGESVFARLARGFWRTVDAWLRQSQGVGEFTHDPACILRISLTHARGAMTLEDGTTIAPGDLLVNIHLWNERLPVMPAEGADFAWARRMHAAFTTSLRLLAGHLVATPELQPVRAIWGETGLVTNTELDAGGTVFRRLGFEITRPRPQEDAWGRFVEFWADFYSWMLIWTYNPASLKSKRFLSLERCGLWMSRDALMQRYGGRAEKERPIPQMSTGRNR